jgi:uncharacterized phage protein gp47/JayE
MPFDRPSLADLIERCTADAATRLNDGAPLLPVSNLAVLSRVLAGAVHGLYGYLDWLAAQVLPDTAEAAWLERHAALWGVARVLGSAATGLVQFTGTVGATIPAGTRLIRADGAVYATTDAVTFTTSTATAPVAAEVAGTGGNALAGVTLTLLTALSGVTAMATVGAGGLTGGSAEEDDARLRDRLLERLRQPPAGGAAADYLAWAFAAHADVTRAWVTTDAGAPGAVTVRVMTDAATADGIPSVGVVDAVQAYLAPRRPVTAAVSVVAPLAAPLAVTLALVPDTADLRAATTAALADLISTRTTPGGTLTLGALHGALAGVAGLDTWNLTSPAADVVASAGYITTLGTVTWT